MPVLRALAGAPNHHAIVNLLITKKVIHSTLHTHLAQNGAGWQARFTSDGEQVNLGTFPSESLAALAHDLGAVAYRGDRAKLNHSPTASAALLATDEGKAVMKAVSDVIHGKPRVRALSGVCGVRKGKKDKWQAYTCQGGTKTLGTYDSKEEAQTASLKHRYGFDVYFSSLELTAYSFSAKRRSRRSHLLREQSTCSGWSRSPRVLRQRRKRRTHQMELRRQQ